MKEKTRRIYADQGGYEEFPCGYEIELDGLGADEMRLFDMMEFLTRPAEPTFVAAQFARLRVAMPRRAEENMDIEMLVDVMVEDCRNFPADILAHVCQEWRLSHKFFPTPHEFRARLDEAMGFRRAVWNCFQTKRNPFLASKEKQKQISADPRLQIHWKSLPREKWMPQHYEWWIAEAEDFLKIAEQYPATYNVDAAKAELERRRTAAQQADTDKD